IQVYTKKGKLYFCRNSESSTLPAEPVQLETDQTVQFGLWKISSKLLSADEVDIKRFCETKDAFVEWFDADRISGSLEICCRKDGDRFWPIGAVGKKKVSRFLIDAQLDEKVKKQAFTVSDAKKILWVSPVRMCEQAKITEKTRKIIQIRILNGLD
ncbi:MAG: tRNA lysidine(34) synthetase TilS, partial [Planctomycetota bacterium]